MAKRKKRHPAPPERVRLVSAWLLRVLVLGVCAIVAAAYAVVRYYTHPREPMWVTVPAPTELPAPELLEDSD